MTDNDNSQIFYARGRISDTVRIDTDKIKLIFIIPLPNFWHFKSGRRIARHS